MLDSRTILQSVRKISISRVLWYQKSFKGNILILTGGTDIILMLFWDIRACKFLESNMNNMNEFS